RGDLDVPAHVLNGRKMTTFLKAHLGKLWMISEGDGPLTITALTGPFTQAYLAKQRD
ncbi:hypothetical protein TSOC_012382, partial [Tetrabaena socialis]